MVMLLFLLLFTTSSFADSLKKVVVLDSGIDIKDTRFTKVLCKNGHKDFTGTGLADTIGHGTHVVGLIRRYAKQRNYCVVMVKFTNSTHVGDIENYRAALRYAVALKPDIVNISAGGYEPDLEEYHTIATHKRIKFVTAAGNGNTDLDYYPGCYKLNNIVSVGALSQSGRKYSKSNYGSCVNAWEIGENAYSDAMGSGEISLSGTSMSTAIHTGKLLND